MVLFDRSWYNRAGVERVMGFCSEEEYEEFLRAAPQFERMLKRSGHHPSSSTGSPSATKSRSAASRAASTILQALEAQPDGRGARTRWVDYSRAKDEMFAHTDTKPSPWYVVQADDKRRARLNPIRHLLAMIPYGDVPQNRIKLPPRQSDVGYVRPPVESQTFIPDHYGG